MYDLDRWNAKKASAAFAAEASPQMSQQTRLFNPEQTFNLSRYSAKYWGTLRMLRNRPFGWSIFVIRFIG